MFWIFANDEDNSLAPYNTTLGTTLANGGRNFHEFYLLTIGCFRTAKGLIILVVLQTVHAFSGCLLRLQDSQEERFSFGNGHCMFKMGRQGTVSRDNRPLVWKDTGFMCPDQHHRFKSNCQSGSKE